MSESVQAWWSGCGRGGLRVKAQDLRVVRKGCAWCAGWRGGDMWGVIVGGRGGVNGTGLASTCIVAGGVSEMGWRCDDD